MTPEIKYIELKSGYNDNGPAWIGLVSFSKSGKTIYFNNKAFKSIGGNGIAGNYMDIETRDEYWISNPKKDMTDRHPFGSGSIGVEKRILADYLQLIGKTALPKTTHQLVEVDVSIPKARIRELENEKLTPSEIDAGIYQKTPQELTSKELLFLIEELTKAEINSPYEKGKRLIRKKITELELELKSR